MKLTDHPFFATTSTWHTAEAPTDGSIERVDCRITVSRTANGWEIRTAGTGNHRTASLTALHYDVRVPRQRGERADWTAVHPSYGSLIGQFVAVDDSISSIFISTDGRYSGSEWMMLDDGRYRTRGVVLHDGELDSRWALSLSCARTTEAALACFAAAAMLPVRSHDAGRRSARSVVG